jgi:repressor LexA
MVLELDNAKLAETFKRARQALSQKEGRKITQGEFADRVGISRSYLGDIETGRTKPSLAVVHAVMQVCDVSFDFFDADSHDDSSSRVPILGTIRAGEPIEAVENILGYVSMPLRGKAEDYFALQVVGDSMNLCGINEGDYVLVKKQPSVENGQIAAVIIDGERATIKRFYQHGGKIVLTPNSSNTEHMSLSVDPAAVPVRVLGLVVKAVINL